MSGTLPRKNQVLTDLNRIALAYSDANAETLRPLLLELYEPFLECSMDNLLSKTSGWDNLAKLVDGQSGEELTVRKAAGLLKVLVNTKTDYSYEVAARISAQFDQQMLLTIRLLLARSLDDCFISGEIATWVAFNYERVNLQVLATIRVLDCNLKSDDNVPLQLHASKLLFARNDEERLAAISICRHLCDAQWIEMFIHHD